MAQLQLKNPIALKQCYSPVIQEAAFPVSFKSMRDNTVSRPRIHCINRIMKRFILLWGSIQFGSSQVLQPEGQTWGTHISQVNSFICF